MKNAKTLVAVERERERERESSILKTKNEEKGRGHRINYAEAGITLVALVVTIIVMLILAGITISLALGDNGVIKRAKDAHQTYSEESIREKIHLAELAAFATGKGEITESNLKVALTQEFGAEGTGYTITDNEEGTAWTVVVIGKNVTGDISKPSSLIQKNPETEYHYTGNVKASELEEGDLIKYYYGVNQYIRCVVLYNDNTHGIQVISEDSVRDVILGCSSDGNTVDPKAVEAFASGAPTGYEGEDVNFEKARWSYNHEIATLNGYAQDYKGLMAENARCVGAPVESIVTSEDETTNMITGVTHRYFTNPTDYNGKFKNADENVSGTYDTDYLWGISEDLKQMDTLEIVQTPNNANAYWLASRTGWAGFSHTYFKTCYVDLYGFLNRSGENLVYVYSRGTNEAGYTLGFRPIFTLKSNIKVERVAVARDYNGTGGFMGESEPQRDD